MIHYDYAPLIPFKWIYLCSNVFAVCRIHYHHCLTLLIRFSLCPFFPLMFFFTVFSSYALWLIMCNSSNYSAYWLFHWCQIVDIYFWNPCFNSFKCLNRRETRSCRWVSLPCVIRGPRRCRRISTIPACRSKIWHGASRWESAIVCPRWCHVYWCVILSLSPLNPVTAKKDSMVWEQYPGWFLLRCVPRPVKGLLWTDTKLLIYGPIILNVWIYSNFEM